MLIYTYSFKDQTQTEDVLLEHAIKLSTADLIRFDPWLCILVLYSVVTLCILLCMEKWA